MAALMRKLAMADVRVLYPDRVSGDTVRCVATLLREARRGNLTGLAFVAFVEQKGFIANACGDAMREPTETLFYLRDLDAKLASYAKGIGDL